tara:strand:+ start:20 stop:559 length:540 start_codon:yes stop_codon:yes gene_type:complete
MDPLLGIVITAILSFLVGFALQRVAGKPNLKYFLPGQFLYQLTEPKISLQTDSLTIQNFGKQTATNIEIIHKEKPDHFQFSQAISFTEEQNPSGEHLTKIKSLGPNEYINIQYLSHTKVPVLLNIRSDSGQAKLIQVQFQQLYSYWVRFLAGALMLTGFGLILYLLIKAGYSVGKMLVA